MQKISFKQIVKYNLFIWTGWWLLYGVILLYQIPSMGEYGYALYSSLVWTYPLFFLSLLLWPLCRWIKWRKMPGWLFFVVHMLLANLFSAAWLLASFGTAYLILSELLFTIMDVTEVAGWQYPQGLLKYMMVSGLYYTLIFYREVKERELRESQLRLSLRETEWKALKAQINPHFLFNALNSINALITSNPGSARQMLVRLSDLLRRVLTENPSQTISLQEELAFIHQYLELEKIRLQDRLQYEEDVDPALLNYTIPVMLLQPLVENAIKHGISNSRGGGWIRLNIAKKDELLVGSIENSLAQASARPQGESESTGLKNLQQRLALLYGKNVQFSAQPVSDDQVFRVQFHFPVNGAGRQ